MSIDLLMIILLPILMAYSLIGKVFHEWAGITMFVMFIMHHVINKHWVQNLFKGKYHFIRIIHLIVNLSLFIIMLLLPVSGIAMSKHILNSFDFGISLINARILHLLAAYWGFVLMSLHLGLHLQRLIYTVSIKLKKCEKILSVMVGKIIMIGLMIYGAYCFISRNIMDYLFLKNQFVYFDFSESIIIFLIDYFAIMILFAGTGYLFNKYIKKIKLQKKE